jgi:hypothetical protein
MTALPLLALLASGGWFFSESKDAMTDTETQGMILPSEEDNATLAISCDGPTAMVGVMWKSFIRTEKASITYRADTAKAVHSEWVMDESGKYSLHPAGGTGGNIKPFIEEIRNASTLLVRADAYSDGYITASFTLAGLPELLPKLRCLN